MPIVQKTATEMHKLVMRGLLGIPENYKWEADEMNYRSRKQQRYIASLYKRKDAQGVTWIQIRMMSIDGVKATVFKAIDAAKDIVKREPPNSFGMKLHDNRLQFMVYDASIAETKVVPFGTEVVKTKLVERAKRKARLPGRPPPISEWTPAYSYDLEGEGGSSSSSSISASGILKEYGMEQEEEED